MEKVRNNPMYLYWTCAVIVAGFMTNRLNVSITALQASSATYYVPKWTEFAATLATYRRGSRCIPLRRNLLGYLAEEPAAQRWLVPGAPAEA